ncbi:acyl-CoA dehydrogenase family protein [Alteribacillus sp. YIM 98480]|uniref:acyl-CoA dehydrogenase family protein n=1 Tax=Alteribacillus sp. YIM 98480 TaxID=2606599 RepID=UPI00131E6E8B|nr:acyl-CoA dehydrogenase family protein [Alteribacillus sp. YIM 98480]
MVKTLELKSTVNERPFFNEEHYQYQKALRKFLEKEAEPYFEQWEKDGMIPRDFWKKVGENGFLAQWVEEEYGGMGVDFGFSVIMAEEFEKVGSGLIGFSTHSDVVGPYLDSFATEKQKEKYLSKFSSGEMISAIAISEPGAGSDLANIKTTAIKEDDHYILNGSKTFITNGVQADVYVLACKTNPHAEPVHKGISILIVDRDTPGVEVTRKLDKVGMRSSDTAELYFDNARIPVENLLGEEGKGFTYLMDKLQQERLLTAITALAAAEDMLQTTLSYVQERKAFGRPISKFQNTQFQLVEIATKVKIARTFLDDLIVKHIEEKNIVTEVSMAKYWITEMAREVSNTCMQLHGGYGYMEEYKIARRFRDIPVYSIFAGTNEIMKNIIAKNIGL